MKKIVLSLISLALMLGLASCGPCEEDRTPSNKVPENKQDEALTNKNEHAVAKIELLLIEGHLHGTYGFHENGVPEGMKYLKVPQKITLEADESGNFVIAKDSKSKQLNVFTKYYNELNGATFGLWIKYYDAKGKDITEKFADNQHQHFFSARNIRANADGDPKKVENKETKDIFFYRYCDTNPWDKRNKDGAPFIGEKDPRGLKGYFWFYLARTSFDLQVKLFQSSGSKEGSSYYQASPAQIGAGGLDFFFSVPVNIFAEGNESDHLENDEMDSLTEEEKKYLNSFATAYGISKEEALKDINNLMNPMPPHSDAGYWF